jgi:hypothetical protein
MIDFRLAQEQEMGTEQSFRTGAASDSGGNRRLVASDNAKGAPVYAADGNRLGRIERVMADAATGEIAYAVSELWPSKQHWVRDRPPSGAVVASGVQPSL